jgi:signal transduction histidine kinase
MLRTHEQVPLSTRVVTAEGEERVVHWQLTTDDVGRRIYAVGRDVTDQQSLEHKLAQARRLEAVGQLAAGVAHELNTPLQFLGDNLSFIADALADLKPLGLAIAERAPADEALREAAERADLAYLVGELPRAVEAVRDGLGRVSGLVGTLKELAPSDGQAVSATEAAMLVPAFDAVLKAAEGEALRGVEVVRAFERLPPVVCHLGDLNRVFASLLSNAAHAIAARPGGAAGGRVVVTTRADGHSALISVTDNGCGMSPAVRAHVFEPFFTTREVGSGAGRSLAVARSVLERHEGSIDFESELQVGSTFTMRLPLKPALQQDEELHDDELWPWYMK